MNINLHIERLILDGLPIAQSERILVQAAVEAELARLLVKGALADDLKSGGAFPEVRAGVLPLRDRSNPSNLGQQIAHSVYKGIGQ